MPRPVAAAHGPIVSRLDRQTFRAALVERMFCAADDVRDVALDSGAVCLDHVCYEYDLDRGGLVHCEVSGYLARFAPAGDVANLSRGGGVIPVLVKGDQS